MQQFTLGSETCHVHVQKLLAASVVKYS